MSDDIFRAIQAKHGFTIPPEYIRMAEEGFFDYKNNKDAYLWIPETE